MKRVFCISLLLLYFSASISAQDCDCYNSTRTKGIQLMQQKQYSRAIEYFKAAEDCPDKPSSNDLRAKRDECLRAIREIEEERQHQRELEEAKRRENNTLIAKQGYMEIKDIVFANADYDNNILSPYGSKLLSSEMRYLKPKIKYNGLASESKSITLFCKIIKPDGTLKHSSTSPDGYTYSGTYTIRSGTDNELYPDAWGNKNGVSYPAGIYRYEIWYNNTKLFSKNFEINDATKGHSYIKVTNILFGNGDYDGNILTDYGKPLFSSEMRYLQPRVFYNGLSSDKKQVKLYWKIIKPDGTISRGGTSPEGFTSSSEYTIFIGTNNTVDLLGWGNKDGGTYPAGLYKYELWCDGNLLFAKEFVIKGKSGEVSYLKVDNKTAVSTTFTANGGTETFYISTDSDSWTTWGIPTWCSVEDKTSNSFMLKCESNTSSSERSDYMKIKAGDKEVRIDVIQSGINKIQKGSIESVTFEQDVCKDGVYGINIHVKFDIENCRGEKCACIAYFYNENGDSKIINNNAPSEYKTSDGHLSVRTDFTPSYDSSTFNDLILFIPNNIIKASYPSGTTKCFFWMELYNFQSKSFIEEHMYKSSFSIN